MAFVLRTSPRTTNVVDSVGAYDTVAPALRACYDSLLRERGVEFDLL